MKIDLYWSVSNVQIMIKDEKSLSFKNRLGCRPTHLQQSIHTTMPEKINKHWKNELRLKINSQFRKDGKAKIIVDDKHIFELSARTAETLVNNIANAMLRIRKGEAGYNSIDNYKKDEQVYKTIGSQALIAV